MSEPPAPVGENPWVAGLDPVTTEARARAYAEHFDRLAARGGDVHGEADLVASLLAPGATVLDAGCGTGRVAARLADQGYRTVGVDLDPGMLHLARDRRPDLPWLQVDLVDLAPAGLAGTGRLPFAAVVAAGNVMPLLTPGTESAVIVALTRLLAPGGVLIAGFGLDDAHLPASTPPTAVFRSLERYDAACTAAGLALRDRWAGWDRATYRGGGYAVSVHAATSG